ncbi:MAG: oxidoreductase [Lentisphaerae bacterium RIFOXYC12_FULL_60_16]|nr:MAG: oxidoreductase [Lentisphaerae bacterium RIFOXYC12_FULL_60_16]
MKRRTAMVTGGAQGIGFCISRTLLKDGWSVVMADIDAEAGSEAVARLRRGGPVAFVPTDVADDDSVKRAVQEMVRRFGRIDAVINNAGISAPYNGPVEKVTPDQWNRILGVNLTGTFLTTRHAASYLRKARGSIVNIASTRALQSEPNSEAYAASKGGLLALTHALAVSLGPAIRVNAICPGWIDVTGLKKRSLRRPATLSRADHAQHPVGRVGVPEDIAAAVRFLVGPESGFITGQNLVIDGGMTRRMIYVE